MSDIIQNLTQEASKILLNKKIVQVRYMTDQEQEAFNWHHKAIIMQLEDGTLVFPSRDDEGNDAGALHYFREDGSGNCIPVI